MGRGPRPEVADQRRKKQRQREEEQRYFHNQMVPEALGPGVLGVVLVVFRFG